MIKILLFLLENVPYESRNTVIARGRYKFPETWGEFMRYLRFRAKGY